MTTSDLSNLDADELWTNEGPAAGQRWLDVTLAELPAEPALVVPPSATVETVIRLMNQHDQGAVLVMEDSKLVGIFTERDVVRRAMPEPDGLHRSVGSFMTSHPCVLTESTSFATALRHLTGAFHHLPVLNAVGSPAKLVSLHSIVAYLVDSFSDEIRNDGIERDAACARASGQWPAPKDPLSEDDEL